MTVSPYNSATRLPAQRAFVVQFYDDADVTHGAFCGRVEHVTSGRILRFHNWQELQTFIAQLMNPQFNIAITNEETGND